MLHLVDRRGRGYVILGKRIVEFQIMGWRGGIFRRGRCSLLYRVGFYCLLEVHYLSLLPVFVCQICALRNGWFWFCSLLYLSWCLIDLWQRIGWVEVGRIADFRGEVEGMTDGQIHLMKASYCCLYHETGFSASILGCSRVEMSHVATVKVRFATVIVLSVNAIGNLL